MELYVLVKDDPLRIKLNASLLAEAKEMGFRSGKDVWSWYLTVGTVLTRMRRSCGPCHPAFRGGPCIHADALEAVARLRAVTRDGRHRLRIYDAQLGSQTKRNQMGPQRVRAVKDAAALERRRVEEAADAQRRIVHRSSYAEACEIFWISAGRARAECFREDEE